MKLASSNRSGPAPDSVPSPRYRPMKNESPSLPSGDPARSVILYDPTAPLETTASFYASESRASSEYPTHPDSTVTTESWTFPLPPLSQTFSTSDEGVSAINDFARPYGYAVSTLRSKFTAKGVKKTVHLVCDHTRKQTTEVRNAVNHPTRALSCQFAVALRLDLAANLWRLTIRNATHNHGSSGPSTHPIHRRRELLQYEESIRAAFRQGRTVRQILTEIREADPESCLTSRDLYNAKWRLSN